MDIKKISTKELVEELLNRDGVSYERAEPYTNVTMSANGPAILIKVMD